MLPLSRLRLPHSLVRSSGAALLAVGALGCPVAAAAQDASTGEKITVEGEDSPIQFEADGASYDDKANQVSVFGNVVLRRGDQSVRADKLTWDRTTGKILAEGNIRFVDADGNQLFTDQLEIGRAHV